MAESNSKLYYRYWGKADSNYPGEPKWHALAYHSLDVAAVGIEYLRRAPSIRASLEAANVRVADVRPVAV